MVYASALDGHLLPRLGSVPIRDLQPADVVALQRELRADGVGDGDDPEDPGSAVGDHAPQPAARSHPRQPGGASADSSRPDVSARSAPFRRRRSSTCAPQALARGRAREAALISLLAYAGLRPGEAFALRWDCVGERALIIEHGRADGSLKPTKTDRIRTVVAAGRRVEDLEAWRTVASRSADDGVCFPPAGWCRCFVTPTTRTGGPAHFDPLSQAAEVGRRDAVHAAPQLREPARPGRMERA